MLYMLYRLLFFSSALLLLFLSAHITVAQTGDSNPPVVKPIRAELYPPITRYIVEAVDPDNYVLTYSWVGNVSCGKFHAGESNVSQWEHSNGLPPSQCLHQEGEKHPGAIVVNVSDGVYSVLCAYNGSETGVGAPCSVARSVDEGVGFISVGTFKNILYVFGVFIFPLIVLALLLLLVLRKTGLFDFKKGIKENFFIKNEKQKSSGVSSQVENQQSENPLLSSDQNKETNP